MHKSLIALSVCACATLLLSSCNDEGKANRGFKYFPDMYQSPALKSQESFTITKQDEDGHEYTLEVPGMAPMPAGTVRRDFIPYDINDEHQGKNLVNPLAAQADMLRLGRDKFNQFCTVCHGKDGNSENGFVTEHFLGVPSINTETVATYADGHIFWIISAGRGRMPDYRAQLNTTERWAVILYLRSLREAISTEVQGAGTQFEPLANPNAAFHTTSDLIESATERAK